MKKDKNLFSNMSREKWITYFFILFILCVPVLTIISRVFPQEADTEDDAEKAVLEGNGTLAGDMLGESEDTGETEDGNVVGEGNWFKKFQSYVYDFTNDLYFKDELIDLSTALTKIIRGNTYIESNEVLLGKENWLFYKTENEGDGNPILDYKGINHFQEQDLIAIAENLTATRDYLEEKKGIRFVMMCLPNKENLYSEYMPDTIPKLIEQSRADQVAEYIQMNTDLDYIYPKEILLREKEKREIYYRTDTHWNQIGAFVGLQAFFAQMYGTYADPDSVKFILTDSNFAGDLATIAGITKDYTENAYVLDSSTVNPEQYHDEVLLIVGDSFSGFLAIVAEPYYKKVYRVETKKFSMSMLDTYRPDIVMWETVERHIDILENANLLEQ